MCTSAIVVGAIVFPIMIAMVGAISEANEGRSLGQAPFHVMPMTCGTVCASVAVPAAINTSLPLAAVASFSLSVFISSLSGGWNVGDIVRRGILDAMAFVLMTCIIILTWLADITTVFEVFILISDTFVNILSNFFGVDC